MHRWTIGVDPGLEGAIAAFHPDHGFKIELLKNVGAAWLGWFAMEPVAHCIVEKAGARPKQGVTGVFNYGTGYGRILGWLEAFEIPFTLVTPALWTKELHRGCTGTDPKERSLQAVRQLFPGIDLRGSEKSRLPHKGIVDALLICEWGRRNIG